MPVRTSPLPTAPVYLRADAFGCNAHLRAHQVSSNAQLPDLMVLWAHLEDLDVPDASPGDGFGCADIFAFCRLDELGLVVTGQRLEPDRAVLACRVPETDQWWLAGAWSRTSGAIRVGSKVFRVTP